MGCLAEMYVASQVYCRGQWLSQFRESKTVSLVGQPQPPFVLSLLLLGMC